MSDKISAPAMWSCERSGAAEQKGTPLTVGEVFSVHCQGAETAFNKEKLTLQVPGESPQKYRLKLIEVKGLENTGVDLDVTSYTVGEPSADGVILTDGEHSVLLSGLSFKVTTSIQTEPGTEPKPFGPFEALRIHWGLSYILILVLAALIWLLFSYRKLKHHWERRKLLKDLDKYGKVRSPFDEFHKELRGLNRKRDLKEVDDKKFLQSLQEQFRLYLVREFKIPAFTWGPGLLYSELKSYHKYLHDKERVRVRQYLRELESAIGSVSPLKNEDVKQLLEAGSVLTETLDKQVQAHQKGRS